METSLLSVEPHTITYFEAADTWVLTERNGNSINAWQASYEEAVAFCMEHDLVLPIEGPDFVPADASWIDKIDRTQLNWEKWEEGQDA